jgi:GH15 family glucan-1,4-alpha-glucosidase
MNCVFVAAMFENAGQALVARAADRCARWLCVPRFDSGACFAALLGTPENGMWRIAPACPSPHIARQYRDDKIL